MQFSNPTTVPSSFTVSGGSIDIVTTKVPFLGVDSFFWPCIASEPYAPTRGTSAVYGSASARPAVITSSGTDTNRAAWPFVPRVNNGKTTIRIDGNMTVTAQPNSVSGGNFGFNIALANNTSRRAAFAASFDTPINAAKFAIGHNIADGVNTSSNQFDVTGLNVNQWYPFAIEMSDAYIDFWFDGVLVVHYTGSLIWPSAVIDTTPQFITVINGSSPTVAVNNLSITWK